MYNHDRVEALWQAQTRFRRHRSPDTLLGKVKEVWQGTTLEQKVVYGVIGVNVGVFGLWRIPALQVGLLLAWALASGM